MTVHDLLDERTAQTIESGLPGICVYLLRLDDRFGQLVVERQVERSLSFDSWKECYLLANENGSFALPTLSAADSAISRLANCELCPVSRLRASDEYRLFLQIAVLPLASDDGVSLSGYVSDRTGEAGGPALDLNVLFGRAVQDSTISPESPTFPRRGHGGSIGADVAPPARSEADCPPGWSRSTEASGA